MSIMSGNCIINWADGLDEIVKTAYKAYSNYCKRFQQKIVCVDEFYQDYFPNKSFMMFLLNREDYCAYLQMLEAD